MTTEATDRLPTDRVPTWTELLAAANRRAVVAGVEDLLDEPGPNAGLLLKGARDEGWDIVIPGTGYDAAESGSAPVGVIVLAGPGAPLEEAVWVAPDDATEAAPELPVGEFLFYLPDVDWYDPESLYEVRFESNPFDEPSFSTFTMDLVLTERVWGFPDFREPTQGWVSWLGEELIIAWTEPGNDDQGASSTTIEGAEDSSVSQAFWVRLARAIALARGRDDGL